MSAKKPASEKIANIPPFGLRMLPELRDKIAAKAEANGRSMNAEIVDLLTFAVGYRGDLIRERLEKTIAWQKDELDKLGEALNGINSRSVQIEKLYADQKEINKQLVEAKIRILLQVLDHAEEIPNGLAAWCLDALKTIETSEAEKELALRAAPFNQADLDTLRQTYREIVLQEVRQNRVSQHEHADRTDGPSAGEEAMTLALKIAHENAEGEEQEQVGRSRPDSDHRPPKPDVQ